MLYKDEQDEGCHVNPDNVEESYCFISGELYISCEFVFFKSFPVKLCFPV